MLLFVMFDEIEALMILKEYQNFLTPFLELLVFCINILSKYFVINKKVIIDKKCS